MGKIEMKKLKKICLYVLFLCTIVFSNAAQPIYLMDREDISHKKFQLTDSQNSYTAQNRFIFFNQQTNTVTVDCVLYTYKFPEGINPIVVNQQLTINGHEVHTLSNGSLENCTLHYVYGVGFAKLQKKIGNQRELSEFFNTIERGNIGEKISLLLRSVQNGHLELNGKHTGNQGFDLIYQDKVSKKVFVGEVKTLKRNDPHDTIYRTDLLSKFDISGAISKISRTVTQTLIKTALNDNLYLFVDCLNDDGSYVQKNYNSPYYLPWMKIIDPSAFDEIIQALTFYNFTIDQNLFTFLITTVSQRVDEFATKNHLLSPHKQVTNQHQQLTTKHTQLQTFLDQTITSFNVMIIDLMELWSEHYAKMNQLYLDQILDLKGKRLLLEKKVIQEDKEQQTHLPLLEQGMQTVQSLADGSTQTENLEAVTSEKDDFICELNNFNIDNSSSVQSERNAKKQIVQILKDKKLSKAELMSLLEKLPN